MIKDNALVLVNKYLEIQNFDKRYQKQFIDTMINVIYCWNDGLSIYFDLVDKEDDFL